MNQEANYFVGVAALIALGCFATIIGGILWLLFG